MIAKVVAQKECSDRLDATIRQLRLISHLLGSLLGAIVLTILCVVVRIVRYFDAQISETLTCLLGNNLFAYSISQNRVQGTTGETIAQI